MDSIECGKEPDMPDSKQPVPTPGVCIPWDVKKKELPPIQGDEAVFRQVWQDVDQMAYTYIWHLVASF